MKKRNIIIFTGAAAVVLSGMVFAGSKHCDHNKDGMAKHKIERMISKMDHHLDFSDQQESQINDIVAVNSDALNHKGKSRGPIKLKILNLDPQAEDFEAQKNQLVNEISEKARLRALTMINLHQQVSEFLTPEQRIKAIEMLEKRTRKMEKLIEDSDQS